MHQHYPMNPTALHFLSLIDGRRPLSSINAELAQHYQQPEEETLQNRSELRGKII